LKKYISSAIVITGIKRMAEYNGEWSDNFLMVMHFVDPENNSANPFKILEAHPDYDAAKNHEDHAAALRLVHDFLKIPENHVQLESISLN